MLGVHLEVPTAVADEIDSIELLRYAKGTCLPELVGELERQELAG